MKRSSLMLYEPLSIVFALRGGTMDYVFTLCSHVDFFAVYVTLTLCATPCPCTMAHGRTTPYTTTTSPRLLGLRTAEPSRRRHRQLTIHSDLRAGECMPCMRMQCMPCMYAFDMHAAGSRSIVIARAWMTALAACAHTAAWPIFQSNKSPSVRVELVD